MSGELTNVFLAGPLARETPMSRALRELLDEAAHMLRYYEQLLAPYEQEARARGERAVAELVAQAYEGLSPRYLALRARAFETLARCQREPGALKDARAHLETMLARALRSRAADTAFAQLFGRLFGEHPLVPSR